MSNDSRRSSQISTLLLNIEVHKIIQNQNQVTPANSFIIQGGLKLSIRMKICIYVNDPEGSGTSTKSLRSGFPQYKTSKKHQEDARVSSKFMDIRSSPSPKSWYGIMWQAQRDDTNSNKVFARQKIKTLRKAFWKSPKSFFFFCQYPCTHAHISTHTLTK